MIDNDTIRKTCEGLLDETTAFLDRLVRFESTPGYEGPAMECLYGQFKDLADVCEKVPVPEDIIHDPDYAFRIDERPYEGRPNLRVVLKGDGAGKSVVFNAHVDVVPPSAGHERPFDPFIRDGEMYGRGAIDDKGLVAVMWMMLKAMKKLSLRPHGDVILHIVIEEETGGNGTLALIRHGEKADCCINLEGCGIGKLHTSVRGALWFTCTCYGRAGHSGSAQMTVSALKTAFEAMSIIEEYHDDLLAGTHRDDPLFSEIENPMPVTFGQMKAGDWPAMAPQMAVFKGVFGILTTPKEKVMAEMIDRLKTRGSEWLSGNFEITFDYRHDTSRIDPELPFVKLLGQCFEEMGIHSEIAALPASADTWFYTNIAGIPGVLTGCGGIGTAHTAYERVRLDEIPVESAVMILFIKKWCGFTVS
ncbi:M20/M25/M40 family metallo-hydrolase [bacterium]|nr:M20/M25/M40 family metallo-hydrolase [bacterium]